MSGGDDYILKPFSLKELEARIIAHLNREERRRENSKYWSHNGIMIDYTTREVQLEGKIVEFTKTEYAIIEFLSMHSGQVFDRERIYERVCGYDAEGDRSDSHEGKKLEKELQNMIDEKEEIALISYVDLRKEYEENKNMIAATSYGFLSILFLIVVFNLVNTTFTNVLSRKRELGILEAIGLTVRQEKKLLLLENFYIVGISSIIGMIIGYPAGYIAFLLLKREANYALYHFPILESLMLLAVLYFLQIMITHRCSILLMRQSVVEKIKYKE